MLYLMVTSNDQMVDFTVLSIDLKLKLSFDYLLKSYDFFEDRFEEY